MGSRKRSARKRQIDAFESEMAHQDFGTAFERERARTNRLEERRDAVREHKACTSKNRYASRADAEEALAWCEGQGRRGLTYYRCPYCHGWHLTSHPWDE